MESFTPHFIELFGGIAEIGKAIDIATMESCVNGYTLADNLIDIIVDAGITHSDAKQNSMVIAQYVEVGAFSTTLTRASV